MTGPQVQVIGADRLRLTLRACAYQLQHLDAAGSEAARLAAAAMSRAAPRRRGRLANSVHAVESRNNEAVAGSSLVYAPVINGGWPAHNISPNPFVERGLNAAQPQITTTYLRGVDAALGHVRGA